MRNFYLLIILVFLTVLLIGCAPEKVSEEVPRDCFPYDLDVEVNDHLMIVSWKTNCKQVITGYSIYISPEPLVDQFPGSELPSSVTPHNSEPYPGDTEPEDGIEHFTAEGLENGVKYYVSVRVVFTDRSLSLPSNEVLAVCGPRGEITLGMRYKSDHDGFSFEKNDYVRADDLDNDLYFFSKDGIDYIASPERLNGFLKANRLRVLPFKGEFNRLRKKLSDIETDPNQDRVEVQEGDWVHVLTPDRKNALLKVLEISGVEENRTMILFYAFSPVPDELIF